MNSPTPGHLLRAIAILALVCVAPRIHAQSNYATPYFFQPLAGGLGPGATNGTGDAAQFNSPQGMAIDGSGNLYVADTNNHTVRKIAPYAIVTTLAGLAGNSGSADGTGSAARFRNPTSVAVDPSGNVYVADSGNNTIRKITPTGVVTTLAGNAAAAPGSADGAGTAARFNRPTGIAVDSSGTVYVSDRSNYTLRRISPAGVVTTLAGSAGVIGFQDGTGTAARFLGPRGVAVDSSGTVYVADSGRVRKVTPAGVVTTLAGSGTDGDLDGVGAIARFIDPQGIAVDAVGNVFVADTAGTIRKITSGGVVTTLAGKANATDSETGFTGSHVRFKTPYGVAVDGTGNLYVADSGNHAIRVGINPLDQSNYATPYAFTTLAAGFGHPALLAVDSAGVLYVPDDDNDVIHKITPSGAVTTLAGSRGNEGSTDGTGNGARFNIPSATAVDGSGNVYVADTGNHTIRKITAAGVVTTLAGKAGEQGSADGTGATARFYGPRGIAVDVVGNVYVADSGNYTVRKITANGVVTTLAGLAGSAGSSDGTASGARFDTPGGIAVDENGNLYVSDVNNYTIRKITSNGVVTTLAGRAGNPGSRDGPVATARFDWPLGVAVDQSGSVYVTEGVPYSTIRKISQGVVFTVAGMTGSDNNFTAVDGRGSAVRFGNPIGIAADRNGNLYISDQPASIRMSVVPPTITTQPTNQTVLAGGTAIFTANVTSNAPLTFQWRRDGTPIPGATTATLSLSNVQSANLGAYTVVVTNVAGSTTSSDAVLSFNAAPSFATQPASQSVLAGGTVTFTAVVSGTTPISYQWLKDGTPLPGATNTTLTVSNVQASNTGNYTVVATNAAGLVVSDAASLALILAPTITTQPANQSVAPGGTVTLTAVAGGTPPFTFQWLKDSVPIPGATNAALTLSNVQSSNFGNYSVNVTNAAGTVTSAAATVALAVSNAGRLVNLSIRSNAGTGTQTLIVGFVVGGAGTSGPKPLLIRGAGPALGTFGLSGLLVDPSLDVLSGTTLVAANDNWNGDSQVIAIGSQVGAFAFSSASSRDAALVASSLGSGPYTVQVTGVGNTTGTVLAEIYDGTAASAFTDATPRLLNVSARTQVGTGGEILIAGFVIGGSTSKTLLIRAIGPTLGVFGVANTLADPKLDLFSGNTLLQTNDNWSGAPTITSAAATVGAFALDGASRDAVLLVTLPPGSYSAQVSGVGDTTGVALVEIYEAP